MGLSPPPKHSKTTPITFFRAIRRGQCSIFYVKSVHPNVHPLCAFRFSVYTQTYTQLYTQPRKTPLSDPKTNPQNAKTARTPPLSVFKPFNIRLSPVNPTFYIFPDNPIYNPYKPLNLQQPSITSIKPTTTPHAASIPSNSPTTPHIARRNAHIAHKTARNSLYAAPYATDTPQPTPSSSQCHICPFKHPSIRLQM